METSIIYVDQSEIREGSFEQLQAGMKELAEFVEANEPRIVSFQVYFNQERTRMTVVHMHTDQASLETHFQIAGPQFPQFAPFIRMLSIDVYGKLDAALIEQLENKAQMLGSGTVTVHEHHAGFTR